MKYIFGVDLGGTTVKNGIFTREGDLLYKWEIPTDVSEDGRNILPDIAASCREVSARQGYPYEQFIGLGIGVPGTVTREGNVQSCVNLGWGFTRVKEIMEDLCGLPVMVGNDADVAALGEMWQGAGKGCSDMVMVTLGTGVGGGVIVDGKLVRGAHGFGAEIGHIRIDFQEKEFCNCGKRGCLEQYCSANGIARQAKLALEGGSQESSLRKLEKITAKSVFDAAKAGDAFALEQVDHFGERMARALSYIACVTDPEMFVIGGGVSKAGPIVLDAIRRYYGENTYGRQQDVIFVIAGLENDAGIYGSAKLLIE